MKRKAAPVRQAELSDGSRATMRADFGLELGALRLVEYIVSMGGRLTDVQVREGKAE